MNPRIDQFCTDLRVSLQSIDDKFQALKSKAQGKADEAERAVREQMNAIQKKLDKSRAEVEAARAKVKDWVKAQESSAQNKIAEWKAKGDAKNLQARADLADDYAKAMSTIASAAVEEAAKAALEAVHAHYDVEASKMAHAIHKK